MMSFMSLVSSYGAVNATHGPPFHGSPIASTIMRTWLGV